MIYLKLGSDILIVGPIQRSNLKAGTAINMLVISKTLCQLHLEGKLHE